MKKAIQVFSRSNAQLLLRQLLLGCLLVQLLNCAAITTATAAEDNYQNVTRIVAVGDVHGDYNRFVTLLRDSGVINRRNNWIAGDTHLVQLGDVPDRGPDTDKVISLLQKLERQAEADGGKVHALIGNHEAMNMTGDLRYVHPDEYAAFRTRNSRRLRDEFYQRDILRRQLVDPAFDPDAAFRKQWEQEVPLGLIEHRVAWNPTGEIGAWVLQHNAIVKINRSLFLHGGISLTTVGTALSELNETIRQELKGEVVAESQLINQTDGLLWYRGLATNPEDTELPLLEQILAAYDVDRVVLGHTPGLGTVVPRFDSRVLLVDAGMSEYYGGHLASLLIEGDQLTTLQRGTPIKIPADSAALLTYFKAIAEIEPNVPALQRRIEQLETQ